MIEIKHKLTGAVLRHVAANTFCGASLRWADLRGADLIGAKLAGADLTWAKLTEADLFGANLTGADLTWANLTEANLTGADLRGADLAGANLTVANLTKANLAGANLAEANLAGADLREADLRGAKLAWANLTEADLRGAVGLPAAPVIADIHRRVYEAASQPGALRMAAWHTCATTHCRAGWVVTLAGGPGAKLEEQLGTSAAAALIYAASGYPTVPNWHASNEDALEDMQKLAGKEAR